jgi:outer membrane protein assembly factor BamA
MSAELRFPLFWYFDGAIFLDAGNVWIYKEDTPARPNAHFEAKRFLNELGVAYGIGLRMDLDFFVLRADFGYRLRSPYPLDLTGSHYYKQRFPVGYVDGNTGENRPPELQIGIGLPFD